MAINTLFLPALIITTLAQKVFPKYEAPKMEKAEWDKVNAELKRQISPFEYHIGRANEHDTAILGDQLTQLVSQFVEARPEIFAKTEVKVGSATFVKHQSKTMMELKVHKKALKRKLLGTDSTADTRKEFWATVTAMSDLKKVEKNNVPSREAV